MVRANAGTFLASRSTESDDLPSLFRQEKSGSKSQWWMWTTKHVLYCAAFWSSLANSIVLVLIPVARKAFVESLEFALKSFSRQFGCPTFLGSNAYVGCRACCQGWASCSSAGKTIRKPCPRF